MKKNEIFEKADTLYQFIQDKTSFTLNDVLNYMCTLFQKIHKETLPYIFRIIEIQKKIKITRKTQGKNKEFLYFVERLN